ncbi:kelch-like protein 3 isoform X2 [Leptinotarsa decemlineata]|uniref:kelch-like protein 3 isoform X2 n=1 Tax=Leptinotarsa decemlineata TaxID=7539 RepID=UPI003D308A4D
MSAEKIVLEIENTEVICRKQTLIENSDYFRTMFEGNFIERKMKKIKLQDVDLKAMEIILRLVENRSYAFENEDILMILHVADMLQFVEIFDSILHEITEILSPIHCLKIWQATEQLSIKPLYLKAKSMALDKFMEVKETECILELSLGRLCGYVGHVHLRADNEFHVFQTVMNWWQANNNWNLENCDVTLLKLLSCIDYQNLDDGYIKEMMEYSGISDNNTIKDILLCLFNLRNGFATDGFSQSCQEKASLLLNSTRSRSIASCPCILVKTKSPYDDGFIEEKSESEREKTEFHVLYYDYNSNKFKKFFEIDNGQCLNLTGFEILAYKGRIYLYGGEFSIGRGEFNNTISIYNPIPERWKMKFTFPQSRRHFKSWITNGRIYILDFSVSSETVEKARDHSVHREASAHWVRESCALSRCNEECQPSAFLQP